MPAWPLIAAQTNDHSDWVCVARAVVRSKPALPRQQTAQRRCGIDPHASFPIRVLRAAEALTMMIGCVMAGRAQMALAENTTPGLTPGVRPRLEKDSLAIGMVTRTARKNVGRPLQVSRPEVFANAFVMAP